MRRKIFTTTLCILTNVFHLYTLQAQDLCAPVMGGAIMNLAAECLNDSTAQVINPLASDAEGWQYSADNTMDGVNGGTVGGTPYEIYSTAFRETQNEVCMVVKGNLSLAGVSNTSVENQSVAYGDIFLNLGTDTFLEANNNAELFGIRFSEFNDSGAAQIGVYKNVTAKSVTSLNTGFKSWKAYSDYVIGKGKTPELGDLGSTQTYYDASISLNVIDTGTYVGPITMKSVLELEALGYDNNLFSGSHTIGFCFQKRLIIDECGEIGGDGTSCLDCMGVACGDGGPDDDNDGATNCEESCPLDPNKLTPGVCGCGVADIDSDGDGTLDCQDMCVSDSNKTSPGICGCGMADIDSDNDGILDCNETCEADALKTEPGQCGCGIADTDSDGDGIADCLDFCANDPQKSDAGACGCGMADTDTDGDGTADCNDLCGNGVRDAGELCDDGNLIEDDGCSSSCLPVGDFTPDECTPYDVTASQFILDGGVKKQEFLINRILNGMLQLERSKKMKKFIKDTQELAHATQTRGWVLSWLVPSKGLECSSAPTMCETTSANDDFMIEYREKTTELHKMIRKTIRKVRKLRGRILKHEKKIRKRENIQFKKNIELSLTIPQQNTVCNF